jgi:hypothetical protein
VSAPTADRAEVTYLATVQLPYRDVRSASLGLRAELKHRVRSIGGGDADWDSLALRGPVPVLDRRGRQWWEYTATVRGPSGGDASAVPQA